MRVSTRYAARLASKAQSGSTGACRRFRSGSEALLCRSDRVRRAVRAGSRPLPPRNQNVPVVQREPVSAGLRGEIVQFGLAPDKHFTKAYVKAAAAAALDTMQYPAASRSTCGARGTFVTKLKRVCHVSRSCAASDSRAVLPTVGEKCPQVCTVTAGVSTSRKEKEQLNIKSFFSHRPRTGSGCIRARRHRPSPRAGDSAQ